MELTFQNPAYLWFLLSIPALIAVHFYSLRFTMRRAIMFANFEAIKRVGSGLYAGQVLSKNIILLIIRTVTLLMLILALCGTTLWYFGTSSNYDFVLAIDASGSMLADDIEPNRLQAAKRSASDFLDELTIDVKVGLISFSGVSFVKARPTDDLESIREQISLLDIEYASGTAIGDAIVTATNLFDESKKASVIIILTDGQSTAGMQLDQAVQYASESNVVIHTIGVATEEGGLFGEMISRIDEESLSYIADSTNGQYFKAANANELERAYATIAQSTEQNIPINLSAIFMTIGIILILIEWILINTRYRTIP